MVHIKKYLKFVFLGFLVVYSIRSCSFAFTWEDFVYYSQQLKDDSSYSLQAKRTATYLISNYNSIIAKLGSLGVSPAIYDNFIGATQSSTSPYYYNFFMYNGGTSTISSTGKITVTGCTGKYLRYDSRNGYSWCIDITNSHIDFNFSYYYGLVNTNSLIPDYVYLQNKFVSPNHLQFEANADIVTSYNSYNGVNVKKGSYSLNSWLLGEITEYLNGYDYYRFILYDQGGNVVLEDLYNGIYDTNTSGALFLDKLQNKLFVKSSWLYYRQVYTLVIYPEDYQGNRADENIVETYLFLPLNAVISGDSLLSIGSGDYTIQDNANNNSQLIDSIFNTSEASSGDVADLYNYALSLFPSGDSPAVLYDAIFDVIEGDPDDFIISFPSISLGLSLYDGTLISGDFISSGEINFSAIVRSDETLSYIKDWVNFFIMFAFSLNYIILIYHCILTMYGVSTDYVTIERDISPDGKGVYNTSVKVGNKYK